MRGAWRPTGSRAVSALGKPFIHGKILTLNTLLTLGALLALAVLLAGCGSGGSSSSATTAATTAATTTPAGSAAPTPTAGSHTFVSTHPSPTARMSRAQAIAFAHAVNLRPSDLPGVQARGTEGEHHGNGQVARCLGAAHTPSIAEVRSQSFRSTGTSGEIVGLQSEVTVLPSPAAAAREVAAIHTTRVQACMEWVVERGLSKNGTGRAAAGKPSFTWASADIPGTEGSYAVRVIMPLASKATGISASYYADILAFASGPAVVELVAAGAPQPYSSTSEEHLLSLLLSRAKSQ